MELADVFAVYRRDEEAGTFKEDNLDVLNDKQFLIDFKRLYNVYEKTALRKFTVIDGKLFMKFGTGAGLNDFAVFKWAFNDGNLRFVDGRAEAEYRRIAYPPRTNSAGRRPTANPIATAITRTFRLRIGCSSNASAAISRSRSRTTPRPAKAFIPSRWTTNIRRWTTPKSPTASSVI
jgi:hypothetical protein